MKQVTKENIGIITLVIAIGFFSHTLGTINGIESIIKQPKNIDINLGNYMIVTMTITAFLATIVLIFSKEE